MKKVAFVTYRKEPNLTTDDALAINPLRAVGIEGVPVAWNADGIHWNDFDALVIRSCWDYHRYAQTFRDWISHVEKLEVPVWNPAEVLRWNMDKRYLRQLADKGVLIPRTVWLDAKTSVNLQSLLQENRLDRAVVKPVVSISGDRTWLTTLEDAPAHQSRLDEVLASTGAMVQDFIPQVASKGEWSFVFFGGKFSHAVLKRPADGDFRVQAQFGGTYSVPVAGPGIWEQAEAVLHYVDKTPLYARVDGIEVDGRFILCELELIEPELFLRYHSAAPQRFAEAITRVCTT